MTDTYKIDVRFQTSVERTQRVVEIAEAFGLGLEDKEFVVFDNLELKIPKGSIVYITGQSGGGKSVLLRELARQMGDRGHTVADLSTIQLDDTKTLIDQIGVDNNHGQKLMNQAGIGDAYLWTRRPGVLSDGQRYRFRLAKAIEQRADVWVADEFMAILDRTSAKCVANSVQRRAREAGATLIVATTHTDLDTDLDPDIRIDKRYRDKYTVRVKP